ncbi:MAG: YceI family protein [Chloroflexota bacterium]|nr:YceI family protein [Chloroflexota bacterium]
MNRRAMVGSIIGIPVVVVIVVVLFVLGKQDLLPGQTQPTAIPVTPFANIGSTAPAGTTVAASTATTAPAAAATIAATTAPTAAASTGNYGGASAASTAPAASTTASGASSSSAATAPTGSSVAAKAPSGATTYTIASDTSQAKVTVNEKLANLPAPSDAVLTTNAIQGQLFLGADTKPVEGAKIMVDLRTLKSDKTQRDNYIRMNTLKADQFPLAEYTVTGVDGWTGPLKEGQPSTFKLLGTMTIHGVTKPVTFDTTAMMQGGAVTGTATTTFTFEDFGMTPPNLTIVKANDLIKLDLTIVANKAG